MKAISIKQPWASLIVEGIKDIENRTWKCPEKYIGRRVLIHASSAIVRSTMQGSLTTKQLQCANSGLPSIYDFEKMFLKGAIIGSVEIVDCVINHPSIWAEKTEGVTDINTGEFIPKRDPKPIYNWVLANPIKFPEPIPAKGMLGFWDYTGPTGYVWPSCEETIQRLENKIFNQ